MWSFEIFALAVVSTFGYLVGRWGTARKRPPLTETLPQYRQARQVLGELETVSQHVRRSLAAHHASILRFKDRLSHLPTDEAEGFSRELSVEADRLLRPTLELSTAIARAYDEIRQQTKELADFQQQRIDELTGLQNREGLDEMARVCLSMLRRHHTGFSVVMIDVDHMSEVNERRGESAGDRLLREAAEILQSSARDTDLVARYGGEEFVVLLPETQLTAAKVFAERVREAIASQLDVTISGGAAEGRPEDTVEALISRADAALYSAKSAGRNRIFGHDGSEILDQRNQPIGSASPRHPAGACDDTVRMTAPKEETLSGRTTSTPSSKPATEPHEQHASVQ